MVKETLYCDICNKDVTNEETNFISLELPDSSGNRIYDDICDVCSRRIYDYIETTLRPKDELDQIKSLT